MGIRRGGEWKEKGKRMCYGKRRGEEGEGKERGRDLPDQCQTASYAPSDSRLTCLVAEDKDCNDVFVGRRQ